MKIISKKNTLNKKGIYLIRCIINRRVYVGCTKSSFKDRLSRHITALKAAKHGSRRLLEDFIKFGIDSFEFEILETINRNTNFLIRESYFIKKYKSCNKKYGYNIIEDMITRTGYTHSKETKAKMSELKKGVIFSDAHKKSLSDAKKGTHLSKKTRRKLSIIGKRNSKNRSIESRIGNATLSKEQVIEIWGKIKNGETNMKIANEYNVNNTAISSIRTRRRWGWLTKSIKQSHI